MREHRDVSRKGKATEPLKDLEEELAGTAPGVLSRGLWPLVSSFLSKVCLFSAFLCRLASTSSGSTDRQPLTPRSHYFIQENRAGTSPGDPVAGDSALPVQGAVFNPGQGIDPMSCN